MAKNPYRTQSDTLKLQRLIDVLKERGSALGDSLETKAKDFLSDVKQKRSSPLIPHYDSDDSSGGSSFGKPAKEEDDDWGSDWEEWEEEEPEQKESFKEPLDAIDMGIIFENDHSKILAYSIITYTLRYAHNV